MFLVLAKLKNILFSYSTPKTFSNSNYERCIDYDIHVVDRWLSHLAMITGQDYNLLEKNVMELGPGSDLGVGLYLLSKGAAGYNAIDVNDLMKDVPIEFYNSFFERLNKLQLRVCTDVLREELQKSKTGEDSKLVYIHKEDFDILSSFGNASIDAIFSQAAFEHFEDFDKMIFQLSQVAKPGALFIAEIDLKTHSRWIREKDPLNIYRFSDWIYNVFRFRGTPNRIRPYQYRKAFEKYGFMNIRVIPQNILSETAFEKVRLNLFSRYRDPKNEMQFLSIFLYAEKGNH